VENSFALIPEGTIMSAAKTYNRHCIKCNELTEHVSVYPRFLQIALRIGQIIVFFVSFAMVYPQTFTTDDQFTAKCSKCGKRGAIAYR
jgi:hypothetical protein